MKNIVVVGAGTMGNGIAHTAAACGFDVTLVDVTDELLQRGVDKGKMTAAEKAVVVGKMVDAGWLGRKSGKGFDDYSSSSRA